MNPTMQIKVQIKTVYGEEKVYPACPKAAIFAQMLGTKTLTDAALNSIEALGYTIEIDQPVVTRFHKAA
jgi:hypothetical protein